VSRPFSRQVDPRPALCALEVGRLGEVRSGIDPQERIFRGRVVSPRSPLRPCARVSILWGDPVGEGGRAEVERAISGANVRSRVREYASAFEEVSGVEYI
jgi:hypothetical protein